MIGFPRLSGGVICLLVASSAFAQSAIPDDAKIAALVRKLGSPAYLQREQARRDLEAIGPSILEPLRRASATADAETARRLADLVRNFEEQVLTQQVLAPKEVHLKLKDASVPQAIAELATISGYPIQFLGDATRFGSKKITLDTGKTSFWQAFERLCDEAGLMERVDLTVQTGPGHTSRVGKNGIRRIYPAAPTPMITAGPILVTPREGEKSYVHVAGSLRTEMRVRREPNSKELTLTFIVSAEPRMLNNGLIGRPVLTKAIDSQNRALVEASETPKSAPMPRDDFELFSETVEGTPMPLQRFTQIRVRSDAEAIRAIREISGKLAYQLDLQNEVLAKIPNPLEAAGKSASTTNGGTMRVVAVKKQADSIVMDVALENTQANPFGNNIIINGGAVIIRGNVNLRGGVVIGPNGVRMNGGDGTSKDLPDLLDEKGQKLKVLSVSSDGININNGSMTRTASIAYQSAPMQSDPRELVLFGTRTHTINVPFRFTDVTLPE